jgi:hypothetical protein
MSTSESKSKRGNFTMVPNELFTLYTRLPDFKADAAMLYVILTHYHNDDYGYAFPTNYQLALDMNCSDDKITRLKAVLERYGLVDIRRRPEGKNDIYVVKPPIRDQEEFYRRFPEAKRNGAKRARKMAEERADDLARLSELEAWL